MATRQATKPRGAAVVHSSRAQASPEDYAMCRSMGHSWHHTKPVGSDEYENLNGWRVPFGGSYGMVGIPSTCTECGKERMRWVSRSGESFIRYRDPDGYETHGDDRRSMTEWRRLFVGKIFDDFATHGHKL